MRVKICSKFFHGTLRRIGEGVESFSHATARSLENLAIDRGTLSSLESEEMSVTSGSFLSSI